MKKLACILLLLLSACSSGRGVSDATTKQKLVASAIPANCVTVDVLTLRSGPGPDFPPVTWLTNGQMVQPVRSIGNWDFVAAGRYQGWLNKNYIGDCK